MISELLDAASGLTLFGRYAFPPNRLGYCGSAQHEELFAYVTEQKSDKGFLALTQKFEAAFPYLLLIAQANNISNPFDPRVVEAYWIGNKYLEKVSEPLLYESLKERFRARMPARMFQYLIGKIEMGAKPHHNFHVFDVYTKAGSMRGDHSEISLQQMDSCRISWGKLLEIKGSSLIVEREPLILAQGKLALGPAEKKIVTWQIDGRGFVQDIHVGDIVAIHWDWASDILSHASLRWLQYETQMCLTLANTTI